MIISRASIAVLASIMLLTSPAPAQSTVTFCELMRNPENYNGTLVKVRATWTYGYEWSYIHCLGCDGEVWLDTSDIDEKSVKTIKHMPKWAGIVNVDVEGVFQKGSFGHLGGYKYQLRVHAVAHPAVISKGMKGREKELEIERSVACGGKKPS